MKNEIPGYAQPAAKSNVLRIVVTVFLVILAILYTAGMRAFGQALSGGAVNSRFFSFLVSGPEGVCLLVWPTLAGFLPWTRRPKAALWVVILALVPVLWAGIVLKFEGVEDDIIKSIWKSARPVVYIFSTLFLLPTLIGLLTGLSGTILFLKDVAKARKAEQRKAR